MTPDRGGVSAAEDIRPWLRKADNDLRNIANNLRPGGTDEDVPWDTVCFHAQQAAEKAW